MYQQVDLRGLLAGARLVAGYQLLLTQQHPQRDALYSEGPHTVGVWTSKLICVLKKLTFLKFHNDRSYEGFVCPPDTCKWTGSAYQGPQSPNWNWIDYHHQPQ